MFPAVQTHQAGLGEEADYFRYTFLSNRMLADAATANAARIGLFKALNSTSVYGDGIVLGVDISGGYGAAFALDVRSFWGAANPEDGVAAWNCIATPLDQQGRLELSQGVISNGSMALANFDPATPVHAARLAYNLLHPNVYNELIDTPSQQRGLLRDLGVDQVTYDSILAWTAQKDAIVFGPRVSKLIRSIDNRNYWATQDYFVGEEGEEIPYAVVDPIPVIDSSDGWVEMPGQTESGYSYNAGAAMASEAWVEMRNGLVAYYIWGNAHQERGRAEKSFVVDPQNNFDGYLVTGRSCITCHAQGVQQGPSEMWRRIERGELSAANLERARSFWTDNDTLQKYYDETKFSFQDAMAQIVGGISDSDPAQNSALIRGIGDEPVNFLMNYVEAGVLAEDLADNN